MFRNDRKFKCLCPALYPHIFWLSNCASFAFRPVNSTSCIMRAIVNPSHRSPDNLYKAWVAVKSDGQIPSECNWCCLSAKSPLCTLAHCRSSCTLQDSSYWINSCCVTPQDTPRIAKVVRVLNGLLKTHLSSNLLSIVPCSERVICLLRS